MPKIGTFLSLKRYAKMAKDREAESSRSKKKHCEIYHIELQSPTCAFEFALV
jgi:hypothetical protein